jgi:hypothetical protein
MMTKQTETCGKTFNSQPLNLTIRRSVNKVALGAKVSVKVEVHTAYVDELTQFY